MIDFRIHGAYGRSYEDAEAAYRDWMAGKDFKIEGGGPYLSIRDSLHLVTHGHTRITVVSKGHELFSLALPVNSKAKGTIHV